MLIQLALLILGLESLLGWCWMGSGEPQVLALGNLSVVAGFAVAIGLRHRPTYVSIAVRSNLRATPIRQVADARLRKAA
jgi:hypothetical protein